MARKKRHAPGGARRRDNEERGASGGLNSARNRAFGGCPSAPTGANVLYKYPGDRGTEAGRPW